MLEWGGLGEQLDTRYAPRSRHHHGALVPDSSGTSWPVPEMMRWEWPGSSFRAGLSEQGIPYTFCKAFQRIGRGHSKGNQGKVQMSVASNRAQAKFISAKRRGVRPPVGDPTARAGACRDKPLTASATCMAEGKKRLERSKERASENVYEDGNSGESPPCLCELRSSPRASARRPT